MGITIRANREGNKRMAQACDYQMEPRLALIATGIVKLSSRKPAEIFRSCKSG